MESSPRGPPYDRGRQRFDRAVRLPQPMGAGGQRPPMVSKGGHRAAPARGGPKLAWLKAVPLADGIISANCVTRPRGPTTYEDAAQRRKRRAGVRIDREVEHGAPPGRPGLTHPARPFGRREPPQHARGASVASFVCCRFPAAGPVVRATERSRSDNTGFHRGSFGPLRPAQHEIGTWVRPRRLLTSCAHRLRKPHRTKQYL
jgi:hypothetical protein